MTSNRRKNSSKKFHQVSIIIILLQSFSFSLAEDANICAGKPFGSAIVDPADCTGYFECIFGEPEHQNCPTGERFDVNMEKCVVGKCPPCTSETTTPSPTTSSESSTPSSTESSSISTEIPSSPGTSPSPGPECSNEPYCQTSENDTFHRDRKDCTKYYVCRNGEAVPHTCKNGMHFDEVTNLCNFAQLVPCPPCTPKPTESSPSPGTECSDEPYCQTSEHGTFHRDRKDCRKYYVCRNGVAAAYTCINGMYFDEVRNFCNYDSLVPCSPCTPKPTESSPSTEPTTISSSSSSSSSSEASSASPTISTVTSPSPGTDCSNQPYCQASEHGTFHRDRKDCRKYYVCRNGEAVPHYCDSGMYFDDVAHVCNFASLVPCSPSTNENCTPKPTTGTPSSSVASPSPGTECSTEPNCQVLEPDSLHRDKKNCRKYYMCIDGTPVGLLCSAGEYFDDIEKVCKFELYVKCTPSVDENCGPKTPSSDLSTSIPTTEAKPSCPPEPNCKVELQGSTHRDPRDCAKFYFCRNGVAVGRSCRKGEFFDLNTNACIFSSLIDCTPIENCSPTESTTSVTPTTSPKPTSTTIVPNGQVDPNITDCSNLPNGTFFRHSVHCNVYYVCHNQVAVKLSCPYQQWFDVKNEECNFQYLVNCPSGMD